MVIISSSSHFFHKSLMPQVERILLGLIVPVGEESRDFTPDLILMGPGLAEEGEVSETLELPDG
ncbi:hypothetical protein MSSAC_2863 [Methanosarcina siciliae C2J]|uniref:Uncharacterized protein n=1 Tax=Methanosarcina siciliae C2J TaxID=1434118 RepID=A0A0E3PRV1_9EURY|nr:hypothetical protein MSSAC_2863 [Methanosarcina siciliae C2J]